jgi:hypothetical protein
MAQRTGTALELKFVYALKTISTRGNVPRNQPDHVTNPIKFSMITTT